MTGISKPVIYILFYTFILSIVIAAAYGGSEIVTVIHEQKIHSDRITIVIDAGHGGEDGGAISCSGVSESGVNLEIALRLNELMHLLGYKTVLIRDSDRSIYTAGQTIAQKKVSDLKERVRIVNSIDNALLISIHQNHFYDSKYSGAQVFFAPTTGSKRLAELTQSLFVNSINPGSNRKIKQASNIYLMQHISCDGILVECGFLSNAREEFLLRTEKYQKKICCVITSAVSIYQNT